MAQTDHSCHSEHVHSKQKAYVLNPLFLTSLATFLLLVSSFIFPILTGFRTVFMEYLRMMWIPIGLGFIFGGLVDYYVPKEYISKFLARKSKRTVFYSAGLGFLASACSHGIIALSMELHKKGASGPAVISFLLASPWANLPITFLLIGFFGWKGILIILSALFVSITTGLLFQVLDQKGWIEKNKNSILTDSGFSIQSDMRERLRNYRFDFTRDLKGITTGIYGLMDMVLWWILIGMILASLISAFLPETIFHRFFGASFLGLLATLALAAVFEVCSEGTSPLAFELYKQTGALGNAFAFLMGGVVTDYTEVGLVWVNLGRKTALWMLFITIPQVFLIGWVFNAIF